MSTQVKSSVTTTANQSSEKKPFNLNTSIQRVRAKWNAATRERREQTAKAMQEKLVSMLMGVEACSLTAD